MTKAKPKPPGPTPALMTALQTIKEYAEGDAPWHVRLDYTEPHLPCFPTREFLNMYDPDELAPWGSFDEEFAEKPYIQKQQLDNWNIADWTWNDWKHYVHQYFCRDHPDG